MRKFALLAAIGLVAALIPAVALAGQEKLNVCHLEGNGTFHLLEVAEPAYYNALIAHGDGLPGGEVPGMPGYVFDDTCQIVEAMEVLMDAVFSGPVGNAIADETGFRLVYGGNTYPVPDIVYHEDYWGSYPLYFPGETAEAHVEVTQYGAAEETLTVVFDVFKLNADGTTGMSETPYPGGSFQFSFLAEEGVTNYVTAIGVNPTTMPYGFPVLVAEDVQGLHLAIAKVYLGTDTTVAPLAIAEAIADLA